MNPIAYNVSVGAGFVLTYYLHKFLWASRKSQKFSDPAYVRKKHYHKIGFMALYSVLITVIYCIVYRDSRKTMLVEFRLVVSAEAIQNVAWAVAMNILLFLGAITQMGMNGVLAQKVKALRDFHYDDFTKLIAAPLLEEWIFRNVATLRLVKEYSQWQTVVISSLVFSFECGSDIRRGRGLCLPLMSFTFLFGLFCGYFIIETSSLYAAFLMHSLCNFLGFPPLQQIASDPSLLRKLGLIVTYIVGIFLFFYLS